MRNKNKLYAPLNVKKKRSGGLSRFLRKKYYPKRSAGVEIFFSKPGGLDLYCTFF